MPGLVSASTAGSADGPLRQISRVRPVGPTLLYRASSMAVLSRSARTATAEPRWLAPAATSSPTTVNTCSDQPRTTTWPCSTSVERPRRRAMSRSVSPVVMRPTRVETYTRATRASSTDSSTRNGVPVAPPSRSVSPVRRQTSVSFPGRVAGACGPVHTRTALAGTTRARQTTTSQPTRAEVPRARVVSNQYRARAPARGRRCSTLFPLRHRPVGGSVLTRCPATRGTARDSSLRRNRVRRDHPGVPPRTPVPPV